MLVCLMCQMKAGNVKNLSAIKHQSDFIIKLPYHPLKIVIEETQETEHYFHSHNATLSRIFCSCFSKQCTPIDRVCRMKRVMLWALSLCHQHFRGLYFTQNLIWSRGLNNSSWSGLPHTPGTLCFSFTQKEFKCSRTAP